LAKDFGPVEHSLDSMIRELYSSRAKNPNQSKSQAQFSLSLKAPIAAFRSKNETGNRHLLAERTDTDMIFLEGPQN
jgi:hypothetical protein